MDFDEFCAAALSVHQLETHDQWEQRARYAYELFEKDGNKAIVIDELASVCFIWLRWIDDSLCIHTYFKLSRCCSVILIY